MIALEDLKDMSEDDVRKHLSTEYSDYDNSEQQLDILKTLSEYDILIAYESVGDYGCDSSSFFLLKNKLTGKLHEVHGSHCSCYGFEGQFTIENESPLEYLKSDKFYFCTGGYDSDSEANELKVKEFISTL